jgi:hypothetical protein
MQGFNDIENTPPGSILIYDEAGVTWGARDAMSEANKLFGQLMQIMRHRQICLIMTAPDLSFLDVQGRKMLHWWFETVKLDKRSGICNIKPHTVEIQQQSGQILYPFPKFENGTEVINSLQVLKPSDELTSAYEINTKTYKDAVATRIGNRYSAMESEV